MHLRAFWHDLSLTAHLVFIVAAVVLATYLIQALQAGLDRLLAPTGAEGVDARERALRASPKLATVSGLFTSGLKFTIAFAAFGLILHEFGSDLLKTYFASATVIGLAVGFGSQGLVQDVVIGLTLIFSDALDVGDTVEIAGQTGRIDRVGLRFTRMTNFLGQTVYVPNRSIGTVGRFRRGVIRAYVDVQQPAALDDDAFLAAVRDAAVGFRDQFPAIVVSEPELGELRTARAGGWHYVRVKFRLWPGQGALVETTFRQRVLARLKELDPGYADWMVTVSYRAGSVPSPEGGR